MRANILKLFTNKFAQKQKNPFAEPLYPKKNDARPLRKSSGTAWRPWGKTKKITARPERLPVTVRWYTHGESNPNRWNRNPLFYPLNYGCMAECGHKSTIIPDSILIIGQKNFTEREIGQICEVLHILPAVRVTPIRPRLPIFARKTRSGYSMKPNVQNQHAPKGTPSWASCGES